MQKKVISGKILSQNSRNSLKKYSTLSSKLRRELKMLALRDDNFGSHEGQNRKF